MLPCHCHSSKIGGARILLTRRLVNMDIPRLRIRRERWTRHNSSGDESYQSILSEQDDESDNNILISG